ncbi:hypothetical protein EFE42_07950 [Methanohalophilus sp. RSK]|uniref:PIN domain-containing protein n=1 Tax=Methanohalophilus sp. RSK TaxID=2485783 RepID=UPI000F43906E|nr:PIN domain-containing protein [Methanohalophilus sp. RSK]RNI12995.1 hypothetical protein EFE42_07950 [Methanohalophilus sp. RSK]
MSLNWNTFVFFDTNCLRSTKNGKVIYDSFDFSLDYEKLEEFISENELSDSVHLGVSSIVIEELKKQKVEAYHEDVKEFQKSMRELETIKDRLSKIHEACYIQESNVPQVSISDMNSYISNCAGDFLDEKNISIVDFPEAKLEIVFKNIIRRALERNHPFKEARNGKKLYKDAGFKDVLIWESLLHYPYINNYDLIIFVSNDDDFRMCEQEFIDKFDKHFEHCNTCTEVIDKLTDTYFMGNINYAKIIIFAHGEYFNDFLRVQLSEFDNIILDDKQYDVTDFQILNSCKSVFEDEYGSFFVKSLLQIQYLDENGKKQKSDFEADTMLDDTLAPEYTSFDEVFE